MESKLIASSDKALLAGCLRHDPEFQEAFIRKFSNLVYKTIHQVLKSKDVHRSLISVEDLHQSLFLQLFESNCSKLSQYKGANGCSLASWIRLITSRLVIDHLRRGTDALAPRHQAFSLDVVPELYEPGLSALERITALEQLKLLEKALKKLKMRDQLVIRLHCIDGQPLIKVSRALGISNKNIHSVKSRAIQRLKAAIDMDSANK
jgi:RNA polymerase sigma factor (sigma-70 family)